MTFKRQAAISVFWVGVATVFVRTLSALKILILAKLLVPADFGLVQIAFLAISAVQLFRELGFGSALIYRQKDLENASDTAFWVILLSSIPLYLLATLTAEPLMRAFNRDMETVRQAVPVLRVLALTMIISSVGQVPTILLAKDLNFRLKIVPEMAGALAGTALAVVLAISGLEVWSLVAGYLLETAVAATAIWFISPWRPRWRFDTRIAKEMFAYGRSIAGSQVLVFLITNIDDAFISKLAGTGALGLYGFAYKIGNLPATQISRLVGQVMFPAFSRVQNNLSSLREIYLKTTRYVSLVSVPASLTIIAFAPEFVNGFYGDAWAPAIVSMQLLGVYGLIRSIAANMGSIFKAGGKPHWLMGIAGFRLAVMAAGLYPATKLYGFTGVSALSAAVAIVDFFISMTLTHRIIDQSSRQFLRMLLPIFVNGTIAVAIAKIGFPLLTALPLSIALLAAGLAIGAIYGALTWLVDAEVRQLTVSAWQEGQRRWHALAGHQT